MFNIVLRGGEEARVDSANPRWLLPHSSIQLDAYIAVSLSTWVLFSIAIAAYSRVFIAQLELVGWSLNTSFRPLFLASATLAIGAAGLLCLGRKIFRSRIHVLDIGQTLPVLNLHSLGRPRRLPRWAARFATELPKTHEYHLLARATEPNVAKRLTDYSKQAKLKLRFHAFDARNERFMNSSLPAPAAARNDAARLQQETRAQADLWPVIKLLIGRSLERLPDPDQHQQRKPEERREPRQAPGARLYLAAKVFLVPMAYWLLLLAFAMIGPSEGDGRDAWKIACGAMLVIWALGTLAYTQEMGTRWKLWLARSGKRPLGSIPLYLHIPHPTRGPAWEELDRGDFEADIEEYMMEASTVFDYVAAGFLALAVGILALL